jgi:hypothetical protein
MPSTRIACEDVVARAIVAMAPYAVPQIWFTPLQLFDKSGQRRLGVLEIISVPNKSQANFACGSLDLELHIPQPSVSRFFIEGSNVDLFCGVDKNFDCSVDGGVVNLTGRNLQYGMCTSTVKTKRTTRIPR